MTLEMKRKWLAAPTLAILLIALTAPIVTLPAPASASEDGNNDDLRIVPIDNWYRLDTNIVTVLFPRSGQKPMFIWWYTGKPELIYVVKFEGLIEYFTIDSEYYRRMQEAWEYRFQEMYMKPLEDEYRMRMEMEYRLRLMLLEAITAQINETWHAPFFPFSDARWNLTDISNITADGSTIGVSFAFKLVHVPYWRPGFKFAENNIMIRVRFYNTTVEETDPETGYTSKINAGEMKMDFVVNKWVWNIDAIKALIQYLRDKGINVTFPEGKTRLALWVNLASINITRLMMAEEEPEEIEEQSTATHMKVDGMQEDIRQNMTATEQEKPIEVDKPVIKLGFANETTLLGGFFRFISAAKVKDFPNEGDVRMVPVKAAYIAAGWHMRLFIGYPYFGTGSLEHDPSIGVDVPSAETSTPLYSVQTPTGIDNVTPTVIGRYLFPLFTAELAAVLVGAVSVVAVVIYAFKWKRKTPVNMVGTG